MKYDVFLSHSGKDRADVDQVRDELKALGYRVCMDYEVLPAEAPDKVTQDGAAGLVEAARDAAALVYVLSPGSANSQWLLWELGFFDGARGKVYVWPTNDVMEFFAAERGYLQRYPMVPVAGRHEFLDKNLPRPRRALRNFDGFPLRLPGTLATPLDVLNAATDFAFSWWRAWGLMPGGGTPSRTRQLAGRRG